MEKDDADDGEQNDGRQRIENAELLELDVLHDVEPADGGQGVDDHTGKEGKVRDVFGAVARDFDEIVPGDANGAKEDNKQDGGDVGHGLVWIKLVLVILPRI